MIGLQEITELVKAHTDVPYYNFFDYNINRESDSIINKKDDSYTNHRNMFWTINYLRILLMLTKHKTHRIMLLVQYKSSVNTKFKCTFLFTHVLYLGHFKAYTKNISSSFGTIYSQIIKKPSSLPW